MPELLAVLVELLSSETPGHWVGVAGACVGSRRSDRVPESPPEICVVETGSWAGCRMARATRLARVQGPSAVCIGQVIARYAERTPITVLIYSVADVLRPLAFAASTLLPAGPFPGAHCRAMLRDTPRSMVVLPLQLQNQTGARQAAQDDLINIVDGWSTGHPTHVTSPDSGDSAGSLTLTGYLPIGTEDAEACEGRWFCE